MDFTWLRRHRSQIPLKKGWDMVPKSSQYLLWYSCSTTHLLHIESIRLLIVACGMLSHSSSMSLQSCWILVGTGTRCRTRWSRASQRCSMGDMYSDAGQELGHFQLPGVVYRSLRHRAVPYHAETWRDGARWMAQQWASRCVCIQIANDKMQLCSLSVAYTCPYHNPTANCTLPQNLRCVSRSFDWV